MAQALHWPFGQQLFVWLQSRPTASFVHLVMLRCLIVLGAQLVRVHAGDLNLTVISGHNSSKLRSSPPECEACCCARMWELPHYKGRGEMLQSSNRVNNKKFSTYDNLGYKLGSVEILGAGCHINIWKGGWTLDPPLRISESLPETPDWEIPFYEWNACEDSSCKARGRWKSLGGINGPRERTVTMSITNTNTKTKEVSSMAELTATVSAGVDFGVGSVETSLSASVSTSLAQSISTEFAVTTEYQDTYKCPEAYFEEPDPALHAKMWQWQVDAACYLVDMSEFRCTFYRQGLGEPLCSYREHCANPECSKCCCEYSSGEALRPDCVDCRKNKAAELLP